MIEMLPVSAIKPSPTNPRKTFDDEAMADLISSVRLHGVLQPVLVRPHPGHTTGRGATHQLVAGERRWRAAREAGLAEIPALVRKLSDNEVLELQVIENLQRQDLDPLEEADGYRRLLAARAGYDVQKIADRVGRSAAYVYERLRLGNLTDEARELLRSGEITLGHANILARLTDDQQELALSERNALLTVETGVLFVDGEDDPPAGRKAVSVREFQSWVDKHFRVDLDQPELPQLFPAAAAALEQVRNTGAAALQVVQITHDPYVPPTARDGGRIIGPRSWVRAAKPCAFSATGIVVVGPHRGDTFPVCVEKTKCRVHWKKEIEAAEDRRRQVDERKAQGAAARDEDEDAGPDKWEIKRQHEERERDLWRRAAPALLTAIAEAVRRASTDSRGVLGDLIVQAASGYEDESTAVKRANSYVPRGASADDLIRHAAFMLLCAEAGAWQAPEEFPKLAKKLGIDLKPILEAFEQPAAEAAAAPSKGRKKGKGRAA